MTSSFETMLRLFASGSLGTEYCGSSDIDADAVISLADFQGVWTVVYPCLSKLADVSKYNHQFLINVSNYVRRNEFTLNVIEKLSKNGIDICLLKGAASSMLYQNPDYRISGDVDVLINPRDESKVKKLLREYGYDVQKRNKNDHHMKAVHPIGGLLEVHLSLYNRITERILFNDADLYNEKYIESDIGGRKIKTLGINDNLNYLTAHYIKHFVTGGSSIRQMMDLLLYMKKYESEIDFQKYDSLMKELRYDKLIKAVKGVGVEYFGMDFEQYDIELAKLILDDCESVGLFGKSSDFNSSIYDSFCRDRKAVSTLKLKFLFWFKYEQTIFSRLFPSKRVLLKRGYSYAKTNVLVPFAWIHNLWDFLFKSNDKNQGISDKTENRKNLAKKLEMI